MPDNCFAKMVPERRLVGPAEAAEPAALPLATHLKSNDDLGDLRSVGASWTHEQGGSLSLRATAPDRNVWATIPAAPDGWGGATMEGAIGRAGRFRGVSVFHTDNSEEKVRLVTEAMNVPTTFVQSGLGAHSTAMFLDDRDSTEALRRWFIDVTGGHDQ